eukprot:sb/3476951/
MTKPTFLSGATIKNPYYETKKLHSARCGSTVLSKLLLSLHIITIDLTERGGGVIAGSKQPIRSRYLGHVTGYQPIRDQYNLGGCCHVGSCLDKGLSVPAMTLTEPFKNNLNE